MMLDRWNEFSWWWYTIMPFAMIPFWVAFVWVVVAKIHADHNVPPPRGSKLSASSPSPTPEATSAPTTTDNISTISAAP